MINKRGKAWIWILIIVIILILIGFGIYFMISSGGSGLSGGSIPQPPALPQ